MWMAWNYIAPQGEGESRPVGELTVTVASAPSVEAQRKSIVTVPIRSKVTVASHDQRINTFFRRI